MNEYIALALLNDAAAPPHPVVLQAEILSCTKHKGGLGGLYWFGLNIDGGMRDWKFSLRRWHEISGRSRLYMEEKRGAGKRLETAGEEENGRAGNAYFTVEAALVFPIVIGTVLFVVYMLLFQYDRCLLEQDLGAAALWGSRQEASDSTELEGRIRGRMSAIYLGKYVAWEITELDASLDKNLFSVQGGGRVTSPIRQWSFGETGNVWETKAYYRCYRVFPVEFIRLCHRLRQFLDGDKGDGADVDE